MIAMNAALEDVYKKEELQPLLPLGRVSLLSELAGRGDQLINMNLEIGWLIAASLSWGLSGWGGACYRNPFSCGCGEARPTTNEGGNLALLAPGKGRVAEWSKATDCKSVEVFLRRFESCLSHLFVVDFREEKIGMRPPECLLGSGQSQADTYDRRRKDPPFHSAWGTQESLYELYAVRVARTVTRGVRVYTCSVVLGPTHPICSMIYGSTGATHFDQLAKILIGYEITGARSSGIFMGILFIAVGSLFKIIAVPFRAASCPPRRAAFSVVLSHKISTPPACWPGESKFSFGQLSTQSSAKNTVELCNARCWCASCSQGKKEERQSSVQIGLFAAWKQITQKSLGTMKKKDISSLRQRASYAYFTYLTKGNELCFISGFMDWIQSASRHTQKEGVRLWLLGERFQSTKGALSPFRMLLRSGTSREENKMLLSLPLSFLALLIFFSNASRAATSAGGRNLIGDAFILARTLQIMFGPMFKPTPYLTKNGKNARQPSSDKGMLPPTIKGKARRREGDAAGEGKRFFDRRGMIAGSSPRSAHWPIGIAAFGLCLPFLIKNSGSARESAGNNRKEGVHVAAAPAFFLVNGAQQVRHLLQKRESTSDNHASARQCGEWPRADLFGYIIQVENRVTGTAV
ncbi:hypothetical protein ACH5RR_018387 [Cinchona calisaya]|uniref:Uncharacterized protein n=1 Tax=Cinchona calisaya TaxID=153742 RepID=A0ABD2ZMK6_9GENT